ncbi:asparagine synthase (glutamine-hydrolyzing) [Haloarcula sp. CBA1130]|uniref:asparagine synthase (glutamine-hydrolyzing) n=1 Tax=unclassified Haloarcula TaxID=2624677 RepID=UPI001246D294|nr:MULTISPECIES: asparagine synthase (glutamine-hydrolyzing) [unclassified Haloarcula]KAA9398356.1 asparagine synthase (glutamine-hydrolyzing) [Haloarcula sp. CBA1129]KAA9402049.1 asparagine synthase (glutamine-hydrolyzing) [Haloarcula sp. CBA1130]
MCGIAGLYGDIEAGTIDRMVDCLTHRGPDDDGYHVDGKHGIAMGMRRLSIIDLSNGAQPVYNEDGTVVAVFNGEIYNYQSLRETLEASGHRFTSDSDTEVLVHLWEEYGEELPIYLNGMFAFAIWDEQQECLFLARDRLGIKPLFVTTNQDSFAWASELQPLLRAGVEPTVNQSALSDYFNLGFSPWPKTLISGIEKLPPANSLLLSDGSRVQRQYWSPPATTVTRTGASRTVRSLLEKSVEQRLQADVPVGAFLSGGLDSSAIVGLMTEHKDDVRTFSVGFKQAEYDESAEARYVSDYFGTDHTELTVDMSAVDILPRIISAYSEPLADPAILPTLLLSKRAREDVKVVLSGEGADELFGGSPYHEMVERHRRISAKLPESLFTALKPVATHSPIKPRHFRYLSSLGSDEKLIAEVAGNFSRPPDEYLATEGQGNLPDLIQRSLESAESEYLHRQLTFDLSYLLPSKLLHKVDFATMQASLEARTPFLDHELVEYVHQVPTDQRFDGTYKPLLRNAVSDLLPERTLQRTSQGFNLPIHHWFRAEYEGLTRWLTPDMLRQTPHVDATAVRSIYTDHCDNNRDRGLALWKIVNYVGWYDLVVRPHKRDQARTVS